MCLSGALRLGPCKWLHSAKEDAPTVARPRQPTFHQWPPLPAPQGHDLIMSPETQGPIGQSLLSLEAAVLSTALYSAHQSLIQFYRGFE